MKSFLHRLFGSAPAAPSLQQQLTALLAQGAQPDVPGAPHGWTATQRAANGRGPILQLLLQHGADVQQRSSSLNQSLLHLAASGMQPEWSCWWKPGST